ncbi:unnamed protein product, partial [Didymodactylos carnosus]
MRARKNTTKFHVQTLICLMCVDINKLQQPDEITSSYQHYLSKTMQRQFQIYEEIKLTDIMVRLK